MPYRVLAPCLGICIQAGGKPHRRENESSPQTVTGYSITRRHGTLRGKYALRYRRRHPLALRSPELRRHRQHALLVLTRPAMIDIRALTSIVSRSQQTTSCHGRGFQFAVVYTIV